MWVFCGLILLYAVQEKYCIVFSENSMYYAVVILCINIAQYHNRTIHTCLLVILFMGLFSFIYSHRILVYENTHTTVLRPFFEDHLGELVPEEILYTLWCKGR